MRFGVCGNTMKRFKISLNQLPQGSNHLKQGGIVRVMEAQEGGLRLRTAIGARGRLPGRFLCPIGLGVSGRILAGMAIEVDGNLESIR